MGVWSRTTTKKSLQLAKGENESLKQQIKTLVEERNQLHKRLRQSREELAKTRLELQDQIDDLQHHVKALKTHIQESESSSTTITSRSTNSTSSTQGSIQYDNLQGSASSLSLSKTHGVISKHAPHEREVKANGLSPSLVTSQNDTNGTTNENDIQSMSSLLVGLPNHEAMLADVHCFESIMEKMANSNSIDHHGLQLLQRIVTLNIVRRHMAMAIVSSDPSSTRLCSEEDLYEIVSRLLFNILGLERCSYAFRHDAGSNSFVIMDCILSNQNGVRVFHINPPNHDDESSKLPLKGTAIQHVLKYRQQPYLYTPDTSKSVFSDHNAVMTSMAISTVMNVPIFLPHNTCHTTKNSNGKHVYSTLTISMKEKDGLNRCDHLTVTEITKLLGDLMYLMRLQDSQRDVHHLSQHLLYAFGCPEPIVKQIIKMKKPRNHYSNDDPSMSLISSLVTNPLNRIKLNSIFQFSPQQQQQQHHPATTSSPSLSPAKRGASSSFSERNRALYAEDVYDVCIVHAEIVNFSDLEMKMSSPINVMNMLQELLSKFDILYKKHHVLKLESSSGGGGSCNTFLGATGILENVCFNGEDSDLLGNDDDLAEYLASTSPQRALAFAKDLVLAANTVLVPIHQVDTSRSDYSEVSSPEIVSLRVGVHWGDATVGVLRVGGMAVGSETAKEQQSRTMIPKFTVLGQTIKTATQIEKSCPPNRVQVSDDFLKLVESDTSKNNIDDHWSGPRPIAVNDSEDIDCWLCNPYF